MKALGPADALDRLGRALGSRRAVCPAAPSAACRFTDTAASEWASTSWISRAILARSASAAAWVSASRARRVSAERLLGLLGAEQVGAAGQAQRPQPDEGERVAEQRLGGRPGGQPGGQERGHGPAVMASDISVFSRTPTAGGGHAAHGDGRAERGQPGQDAAGDPQHGQGRDGHPLPAARGDRTSRPRRPTRYAERDGHRRARAPLPGAVRPADTVTSTITRTMPRTATRIGGHVHARRERPPIPRRPTRAKHAFNVSGRPAAHRRAGLTWVDLTVSTRPPPAPACHPAWTRIKPQAGAPGGARYLAFLA